MPFKNKKVAREYNRRWAKKNSARRHELNNTWRAKIAAWFEEFKATLKCSMCPEKESCCLEFHHVDPKGKDLAISEAVYNKGWSKKRILGEISKCIVICANCHRKVHAGVAQPGGAPLL